MLCVNPHDEMCMPPEVCGNAEDNRQEHLTRHSSTPYDNRMATFVRRDQPLIIAIFSMVILMNVPYIRFVMYPFMIFSTWVHESFHGIAAVLVGGGINDLYIYEDGSGLASTWTSGEDWKKVVVASAGYTGTALLGGVLLLFRRTRRGPTYGCIGIGICMLLSADMFISNTFGDYIVVIMGIVIILVACKLKAVVVGYLFSFLAAAISFNAFESIHDLYGSSQGYVNGEIRNTDAHTVAGLTETHYLVLATIWLVFAAFMSLVGLVFVFDGATYNEGQRQLRNEMRDNYGASGSVSPDYEMGSATIYTKAQGKMGGTALPGAPPPSAPPTVVTATGVSTASGMTQGTVPPNKMSAMFSDASAWCKKKTEKMTKATPTHDVQVY